MALILVEGVDRAGKTTECRRLLASPHTRPTVLVHFVAPPPGQSAVVLRSMELLYAVARREWDTMDFVCDRSHVSWFAYEVLMRNGRDVPPGGLKRWEREHLPPGTQLVVVMAGTPQDLVDRDDGQSTWTRGSKAESHAALRHELAVFDDVVEASACTRWERPGAI